MGLDNQTTTEIDEDERYGPGIELAPDGDEPKEK
jgi:hypothetical protein